MYSHEERLLAVELVIKLGKRPKAVIRQLSYPTKNSLKACNAVLRCSFALNIHHRRIDSSALPP